MTQLTDLAHTLTRNQECLARLAADFPKLRNMPDFREAALTIVLAKAECADLVESQGVGT